MEPSQGWLLNVAFHIRAARTLSHYKQKTTALRSVRAAHPGFYYAATVFNRCNLSVFTVDLVIVLYSVNLV